MSVPMLLLLQAAGGRSTNFFVFQMLAIALVFYFLILRPQGRARKAHAALLAALKRNDEVMTSGGIVGKVKEIKEIETNGVKESRVTIESGTATVVVERSRIVRVGNSEPVSGK